MTITTPHAHTAAGEYPAAFDSAERAYLRAARQDTALPFDDRVPHAIEEHACGVSFGNVAFETWQAYTDGLLHRYSRDRWLIGDALNHGEAAYGEKYDQWLNDDTLSYQSLRIAACVAARFPMFRRRNNLPWSWHAELAALDDDAQERLLDFAASLRWAGASGIRDILRQAVRDLRGLPPPPQRFTLSARDAPETVARRIVSVYDRAQVAAVVAALQAALEAGVCD